MEKIKKTVFAVLSFAVMAIMIGSCSDDNDSSRPLEEEEYFIILSDSGVLTPALTSEASPFPSSSEATSGYTLVMENVSKSVTWFSNRPNRDMGQKNTSEFISITWPDRFIAIKPNAVLDCRVSGQTLEDGMYLTLGNPAYDPENDRLSFAVTLHNWTMDEKPTNPLSFDHVKLTLLPNCNNQRSTCWSWAQASPSISFVPSDEDGKYLLKMNNIYRELYHLQHAPGDGSEIMSTRSMETYWANIFQGTPPNASLSAYTETGELNLVLLTIDNPSYDSEENTFTYEATVLSGDVDNPETMNTATLLIDSTGPVDYQKAAETEYEILLNTWIYQGDSAYKKMLMWYQGNALDTLIDYVAITQDPKGSDLGKHIVKLWPDREHQGAWWDDFGWWGIALLNAAQNHSILGQKESEFLPNAAICLEDHMDQATQVWTIASTDPNCTTCLNNPPANWYRFEPRFAGGVWNTAFAGLNTGKQSGCKPSDTTIPLGTPEDYCSLLTPLQNTVTNGLYLVLNTRYYPQVQDPKKKEERKDRTLAIYGWFKNWMDVEDKAVSLCPVSEGKPAPQNKIKPSLLNSETGLLRERTGTYGQDTTQSPVCFTGVKWYEQGLSWTGDQGIVLGGLVDILNSDLTEDNQWLLEKAKGILDGVKDHLTKGMSGSTRDNLAPEVLRPWTKFDGWGPYDAEDPDQSTFTSPGGFGFGDPDYPQQGDPEYDEVCACDSIKKEPPCPQEPPKIAIDPSTNYIAGPGIFMRYLVYAYQNNKELRDHIQSKEYLAFLKANADAVAYGTYSCSCNNTIDTPASKACSMSCQITRLATLNAAMVILTSR